MWNSVASSFPLCALSIAALSSISVGSRLSPVLTELDPGRSVPRWMRLHRRLWLGAALAIALPILLFLLAPSAPLQEGPDDPTIRTRPAPRSPRQPEGVRGSRTELVPSKPSVENTSGVKCRRRSRQGRRYFDLFWFSCLARILDGSVLLADSALVSVIRTSKTVMVPLFQKLSTAMSPRSSSWMGRPWSAEAGRPGMIRGSVVTALGCHAVAHRWCHSAAIAL